MNYELTGETIEIQSLKRDRWDLIAHRMYGDASLQGVIIRANRRRYADPLRPIPAILVDEPLTIPIIRYLSADVAALQTLPPWKRGLAS